MLYQQLTLNLNTVNDYSFALFVEAETSWVTRALLGWLSSNDKFCWLFGDYGAGKTHLLYALGAEVLSVGRVFYLDLAQHVKYNPEILLELEDCSLICLDNCHAVVGNYVWEKALFGLYNDVVLMDRAKLIMSSEQPPSIIKFGLPDLVSRVLQGLQLEVRVLSVDLLEQALLLRANGWGFELDKAVTRYLLERFNLCSHCLFGHLEVLNEISLQAKRKITIPLIKEARVFFRNCSRCEV